MNARTYLLPAPVAALIALAACGQDAAPPAAEEGQPAASVPAPSPPGLIPAEPPAADLAPPALVPDAEKGEAGARNVLLEWARALEQGDYRRAYAQWGDHGERSGMTPQEFASYWSGFRNLTIAMPEGAMDGAAGSLYYEAPTTVTGERADGEPVRMEGSVILRRVNDVPGATAEQLRWHLEKVDLQPVD